MKQTINVAVIGFGQRGTMLLIDCLLPRRDVQVVAVCDVYQDRREHAADLVKEAGQPYPFVTEDYREILAMDEVDAVVIASSWVGHIELAIASMKSGKYTAVEVSGAYSIEDCWRLVRTQEETGTQCMMLENCCYGQYELMLLNMVRKDLLGEVVHCEGGYRHDLRKEIAEGKENRHYRLDNYRLRNCDNYPTHELGPIATILDINRGNRMVSLNSIASKAAGLRYYITEQDPHCPSDELNFMQGDVVTTIIKCARGETITLTLDTTLPRAYSRGIQIHGTRGMYCEDNNSLFLDKEHEKFDYTWKEKWNNADEYLEEYEHPIWKKFKEDGLKGGHGGMDWLVIEAFVEAVREQKPVPIDIYDMASWMCISTLSEQSIAAGGAPVAIPDFTNGKWTIRDRLEM